MTTESSQGTKGPTRDRVWLLLGRDGGSSVKALSIQSRRVRTEEIHCPLTGVVSQSFGRGCRLYRLCVNGGSRRLKDLQWSGHSSKDREKLMSSLELKKQRSGDSQARRSQILSHFAVQATSERPHQKSRGPVWREDRQSKCGTSRPRKTSAVAVAPPYEKVPYPRRDLSCPSSNLDTLEDHRGD